MQTRGSRIWMVAAFAAALGSGCMPKAPPHRGPNRSGIEFEVQNVSGRNVDVFVEGLKIGESAALTTARMRSTQPPSLPYSILLAVENGSERFVVPSILHERELRIVVKSPLHLSWVELFNR